jgi:hypothetical protein
MEKPRSRARLEVVARVRRTVGSPVPRRVPPCGAKGEGCRRDHRSSWKCGRRARDNPREQESSDVDTSSIEDRTEAALRRAVAFHFIWQRRVSRETWNAFRSQCPLATPTAPRTTRVTRSTRSTTSHRTTSMSSSARRSDADDGGGDPPLDPAPLGAEGRATGSASRSPGPWLSPEVVVGLHREEHDRIRARKRYMAVVRGLGEGWS